MGGSRGRNSSVTKRSHTCTRAHTHIRRHEKQTGRNVSFQTDRMSICRRSYFLLLFASGCWLVSWHKAVVRDVRLMIAKTHGSISCTKSAFCIMGGISERLWKTKCKLLLRFRADCEHSVVPVSHTSQSHKRLVRQLHCLSNRARSLPYIIHGENKQMDPKQSPPSSTLNK